MRLESHFALGWIAGAAPSESDRLLRSCCVAAAVLPDIDGITALGGAEMFNRWHHTFGHNIFLGLLAMGMTL